MIRPAQQPSPMMQTPTFRSALPAEAVLKQAWQVPKAGGFLRYFDYQKLGDTSVNQIKLLYGSVILSRFAAAATRSWNELRETMTRDTLGYTFWLFTVPMLQRLILRFAVRDKQYRNALLRTVPKPEATGIKGAIKKLLWAVSPVSRWQIASSSEIKDWGKQALYQLERQGVSQSDEVFKKTEKYFHELLKRRNLTTGFGVALTIAILGVGINLVNMALTRKAVAEGRVGKY